MVNQLTLNTLSDADVEEMMYVNAFRRAKVLRDKVGAISRLGNSIAAPVNGGQLYISEATIEGGSLAGRCSCSHAWSGPCKHIGALLLVWIERRASFGRFQAADRLARVEQQPAASHRPRSEPDCLKASLHDLREAYIDDLSQWISQQRVQDLRALARSLGWTLSGTRKADIVAQVVGKLIDSDAWKGAIERFTPAELATVNALAVSSGHVQMARSQLDALAKVWHPQPVDRFQLAIRPLLAAPEYGNAVGFAEGAMMPAIVAAAMPLRLVESGGPPQLEELAEPLRLLQTVNQLLIQFDHTQPLLRPPQPRLKIDEQHSVLRGWPYEIGQIEALAQQDRHADAPPSLVVPPPGYALPEGKGYTSESEPERLDFYYYLMANAGLLYPGSPVKVWQETQLRYAQLPPAEQQAVLACAYFSCIDWSELWPLLRSHSRLKVERSWRFLHSYTHLLDHLRALRIRVLHLLALMPDAEWLSLDKIEKPLRQIFERFDDAGVFYERHGSGRVSPLWQLTHAGRPVDWEHGQRRFLQQVVRTLHWLDLADLGTLEGGRLTHVRLQGLANLYWSRSLNDVHPTAAAGTPEIEFDGLMIYVTPNSVSAEAHAFLDQIGRLVDTGPTRFSYEVDVQAVYNAFEQGATYDDLVARWRDRLDQAPPAALTEQLRRWWASYGRLRLYDNIALIELGDAYALKEMLAVTSLEQHLIAELNDRQVLIPSAAVEQLVRELQQAGYTPKVT